MTDILLRDGTSLRVRGSRGALLSLLLLGLARLTLEETTTPGGQQAPGGGARVWLLRGAVAAIARVDEGADQT